MKPRLCPRSLRTSGARSAPAFTLIEMVGVLAVIMILATLIFSVTVRQLDQLEARKEDAALARLAEGLIRSIQRTRSIPAASNWVAAVAAELGEAPTQVEVNPRNRARILWVDPRLEIGANGRGVPYRQGAVGSVVTDTSGFVIPPKHPRLMLLSSLGPAFPASVVSAGAVAANFDALWDAPPETRPRTGPWADWSGYGRDLRVQRLHLGPLFVRLILQQLNSSEPGRYVIDGLATNLLPPNGVNAFFIKGTALDLLTHTGARETRQILLRDTSFMYTYGAWRGTVPDPPLVATNNLRALLEPSLTDLADLFSRSPRNRKAKASATPDAVLDAMENFMAAYQTWAAVGTWPKGSDPRYKAVLAAQVEMSKTALNLMNSPREGGCN